MSPEEIARYNEHWVNVAENISNESLDNQIAFIKSSGITKPGGGKYRPTKISATVDLRTGDICFGYNGANSLDNPFASKQSFEIWSVDNCAEVYSVNNALLNRTSWDDLLILNILRMVNGHRYVKIVKLLLKMSICQRKEINVYE